MTQQVGVRGDSGSLGEGPERPAGMLRTNRRATPGAQQQVELDRLGGLAGLDEQQPQGRATATGRAAALLVLLLVVAQRVDREGGQAQDGLAGGRLEGADDQQLAADAVGTRPAGGELLVDAGQRLAEPQRASLKIQVVPFQAAQLADAGAGCRRQDRKGGNDSLIWPR